MYIEYPYKHDKVKYNIYENLQIYEQIQLHGNRD